MAGLGSNKFELLQIAEAVAHEKTIDVAIVVDAMQSAIEKAAGARYGSEKDLRCRIDRRTGELTLAYLRKVVEAIDTNVNEILLEDATLLNPDAKVGDLLSSNLPPLEFGRNSAQAAKQIVIQKIREAERSKQFDEYVNRVGEVISSTVKRVEYGNVYVSLGNAEAIVKRKDLIPNEVFKYGDRIRAYIYDVVRSDVGSQVFLSRNHPQFLAALFTQEVPEIYEGIVRIHGVARDPGSRAKISVSTSDRTVDPVGACVGMRGSRVQAVISELQGERIDIVPWSEDPAELLISSLHPAEVAKLVMDEAFSKVEIVVPDDQLSIAIGRRGQNVRLAAKLTGWEIDLLMEQEESERRNEEFNQRSKLFIDALDVDETIAQLIATEGFALVEDLAETSAEEIAAIDGFDAELAAEIQGRARVHLEGERQAMEERRVELGLSDELATFEGLTASMLVLLAENGILTLEDFAGLVPDDLVGYYERNKEGSVRVAGLLDEYALDRKKVEDMVMSARKQAGWIDQWPPAEEVAPEEASDAAGVASEEQKQEEPNIIPVLSELG